MVAAYHAGDTGVTAAVAESQRHLGQALAAIHVDTGVERIVLQGGFALALGERWRAEVAEAAAAACWSIGQSWPDIVRLGHPDDDSALIGAGWFVGGAPAR